MKIFTADFLPPPPSSHFLGSLELRSHDFAIGCHLAPRWAQGTRDQNECLFVLVASVPSMVSDNRVQGSLEWMNEWMKERSQEGSVEADPGRGRIGHRDSGLCSEAEQWLTTWSRPPPGSCPLLTSTSRCLVFSMALLTVCSVICSLACFCRPHLGRLPQLLHNSTGNLSPCSPLYPALAQPEAHGGRFALFFFLFSFYLFIFHLFLSVGG